MLCIHNNLSAGTQNVTGAYVIIMLIYMRLKNSKSYLSKYNLEVHDVIKYMQKHLAIVTNYITCKPILCDVISRSRNMLSSPSMRFAPC